MIKISRGAKIITFGCFFLMQLFSPSFAAIELDAGSYQFLDWNKTKSAQLSGKVSSNDVVVEWSCPANTDVRFNDSSLLNAEVIFPRPGYYLLHLTAKVIGGQKKSDTVIINVFKSNAHIQRLADLINLMTIDEKISQLINNADSIPRLNIPEYNYWNEALHGVADKGVTSFPQCVALGSTWDPELVKRIATAISDEARIKNATKGKGLTYWSPTINIARDPRWGRNEESYSEDPYLLLKMGVAFIQGMQGDHPYYLKTVSTPKHFIANNEEFRRRSGSADVDMRSLLEYYMPAFEKAIVEAKAYSIMGAYNELNQVPSCGNYYLLTDILRRKWGFEGFVVSDCGAIRDMHLNHRFFDDGVEAAARGLLAGCDLNCGEYYALYLHEALQLGFIKEEDIDKALGRILAARFRLGEFDPAAKVPYKAIPSEKIDSQEHRDLALEAARKSIVLLKNDGILPLDVNKVKSIAVIGPDANKCQLGIYSGIPNVQISPLEGIKNKTAKYGTKVSYARGCDIGGVKLPSIYKDHFTEVGGSGKTGMLGEYFNNKDFSGEPVLTRIDSMIDFTWDNGSPHPKVNQDFFSVRWTGKIIAPLTGTIKFGTRSNDGARLYLDGKLLIDGWIRHSERANIVEVEFEKGKEYEIVYEYFDDEGKASARLTWDFGGKEGFEKAIETARGKDLVILVLGTNSDISTEGLDRLDISLPQIQRELLDEVAKVNQNIVITLINGGPVALAGSEEKVKAIIEAWFTGQSSGTAIADVLFGDVNPSGKLPVTFYASTDQLPPFSDYDIINNERSYMYFERPVLYPFGYGLSYTTFEYSDLKVNKNKIGKTGELEIQCTIENSGRIKGDEVVQLYVHDKEASVKVPIRQLKRFKRITLKPNEKKTISFNLLASELSFYDIRTNNFIIEPGYFEIQIGSSSADIRLRDMFNVQ